MSLILLIETATEVCSVGLYEQGGIAALEESNAPYDHAASITLLIDACFRSAGRRMEEIDAVAVSRGPGSYTALRVGAAAAKGICYALDKPLIGVDTLQALALAALQAERPGLLYCPMIDARRMEVYSAVYDEQNQLLRAAESEVIDASSYGDYFASGGSVVFCGNGAAKCRPFLTDPKAIFFPSVCSAASLGPLAENALQNGQFEDLAYFTPLYLKPPNITIPKKIL